jgi:hypothetical protein
MLVNRHQPSLCKNKNLFRPNDGRLVARENLYPL